MNDNQPQMLRMIEALLFAASEPLDTAALRARLPEDADVDALLVQLQADYRDRGVNLVRRGSRWLFETAPDLSFLLQNVVDETHRLSRAAAETLAIIAYHQPTTRAEIEQIRGVSVSKGTLDVLMETGWIKPKGRRRTPGRPVTYGTTEEFLVHFGIADIADLPGLAELKAAGLLDAVPPADFQPDGAQEEGSGDEDQSGAPLLAISTGNKSSS